MASLAALRISTRRLIDEQDTTNTHFTDSEINDYLNQATQYLGVEMEWPIQTSTATAIVSQALYTLPDDFVSVISVYFNNLPLQILDRNDLTAITPNWQNTPTGKPRIAYKADNAVLGLWPAPDADNADLDIQIEYIQVPATLSSDSDIPDLHTSYQICLPFYAAFLCDYRLGNDKKADLHFKLYEKHRTSLMSKVQKFSDSMLRFKWG